MSPFFCTVRILEITRQNCSQSSAETDSHLSVQSFISLTGARADAWCVTAASGARLIGPQPTFKCPRTSSLSPSGRKAPRFANRASLPDTRHPARPVERETARADRPANAWIGNANAAVSLGRVAEKQALGQVRYRNRVVRCRRVFEHPDTVERTGWPMRFGR